MINNFNDNLNNPGGYYSGAFNPNNQQKLQLRQYAFVNGIEAAKAYQMPTNQTMLLMDADYPICYMKTSDAIGKCSLRYFKLEEADEQTIRDMMQPTIQSQTNFATKEDIDNLNKKMDDLLKRLDKSTSKKEVKESI